MDVVPKSFSFSSDQLVRTFSRTTCKKTSVLHTWVIEDFSLQRGIAEKGGYIESPKFESWTIRLFIKTQTAYDIHSATFYLVSNSCGVVRARCQSWIVGADGARCRATEPHFHVFYGCGETRRLEVQSINGALRYWNKDLLPGDTLTVCVQITALEAGDDSKVSAFYDPATGPRLEDDLRQLFASKRFADVVLVAGKKAFPAHKAILGARSSVFDAMFRSGMKECNEDRVQIDDLSAEVVEEMLTFIYTNEAPKINVLARDLLRAADKYDLQRLKAMCAGQLLSEISSETAVDVLCLALQHNSASLKACAIGFIKARTGEVLETEGWKRMVQGGPALMESICRAVFQEQNSSK